MSKVKRYGREQRVKTVCADERMIETKVKIKREVTLKIKEKIEQNALFVIAYNNEIQIALPLDGYTQNDKTITVHPTQ